MKILSQYHNLRMTLIGAVANLINKFGYYRYANALNNIKIEFDNRC